LSSINCTNPYCKCEPGTCKRFYLLDLDRENLGIKYNEGKIPLDKVLFTQFPKAIQAIAKCSMYGHEKYKEYDKDMLNFKRVEGGSQTYADAVLRHSINKSEKDPESGLPHIYHKAWNALAELELWIEENENYEK